jgi:CRP-like cAMP-binding protein
MKEIKKTSILINKISKWEFLTQQTLNNCHFYQYKNKEYINHSSTEMENLFIILSGRAKITTIEKNGKQFILQFLQIIQQKNYYLGLIK